MTKSIFTLQYPQLSISGCAETFPIHRIYCVGQNYAAHTIEMGGDPDRESPFFFSKPADAIIEHDNIPWPGKTQNLHHEVELVVALGKGGKNLSLEEADDCVFGYAVGVDLTRRDLQTKAKQAGRPWDTAKGFDFSAPIGQLLSAKEWGPLDKKEISLSVNGQLKQQATLEQLIWNVPELLKELSIYYTLTAGDLVFTGTPEGVGKINPDDKVIASIDGLPDLIFTLDNN